MSDDTKEDVPAVVTERALERSTEDDAFTPVIVKRTDESRRHPDDVLESAIEEGLEQVNRPAFSLFLSAVAAGLILTFTVMAVALAHQLAGAVGVPEVGRLATALVYPLGFVLCILSGTELFTEHTATAVYPVLDKRASISGLGRLWSLVLLGNLVGAGVGSVFLVLANDVIGARQGYIEIGHHLVSFDAGPLVVSSILAGWLMALGAWLVLSTPRTLGQIACIYIVTFLIGLGGLHHSIAGSAEIFTALLSSDAFAAGDAVRFIGTAVVGNLIGGSLFVASLNYAHIRKTREVS